MNHIPECMFHSRLLACKKPYGASPAGEPVEFTVYPRREHSVSRLTLWVEEDGQQAAAYTMRWFGLVGARDRYCASFTPPHSGLYWYWFTFDTADGPRFCARGYGGRSEVLDSMGDRYQLTVYDPAYQPPRWFGEGITYNIFPDRFCRDREPVQPEGEGIAPRVLHENWDDLPVYRPDEHGEILNNDFFGGNFAGICEKLPYLQELGVGVLYLNPIFMAWSNHRYDTADYRRPDPMLGTEEDFRTLCDEAHARGMRVILDGVFSHTGSNSVYFDAKHVFGHGAVSDPNSPYRRWYRFHRYPDDYEAWWGIRTLPCVEELDETYLHYIIEDEDSVIAHWLRLGADGFRLDVVDELPDEFVRRLRRRMRQIDPQSLLLGEVWEDASNKRAYGVSRRYFVDGELDSVMNYPWRNAIVAFLTDADDGTALGESLMTLAENYPPEVLSCVMNHLGTHDTPRILTVLGEPFCGTKDERAHRRMTPVQRKTALMRLRMAVFLQFTLPGMPCIYYGDEAGMEGFEDPFCRACYPWGREDEELQAYYRMMTALRGSSEALRRGGLRVLAAGSGRIAFSRAFGDESLIVCVNHSIGEWVLPAGRVRFAESAAPSPTGEVVLMRGGFCLLEPSDPEAHISIE